MACTCETDRAACPDHGVAASNARENEYFADCTLKEQGATRCEATHATGLPCDRPAGHIGKHKAFGRSAADIYLLEHRW